MKVKNFGARGALAAGLVAVATLASAGPAVAARPPTAEVQSCARLTRAAKRACSARNAANRLVLKKLLNAQLVGTRGDGAGVDWTFCASGKYDHRTTSDGSTGISRGNTWRVSDAVVRSGGSWFDAIVSAPGGLEIAIGMRGGRWQAGISFGNDPSDSYGPVVRTDAKAACAAL